VTTSGLWLVAVEERLAGGGASHRLVAVATDGSQQVVDLADDTDFVAAPRPSPDGRWLVWVAWDHPSMPWDSSEVRMAPLVAGDGDAPIALGPTQRVAGGDGCSVGQPRWCEDGSLVFVDDRSGWWLPYRVAAGQLDRGPGGARALVDVEAEFHAPDWALGQSTIDELADGSLVARMHRDGSDHLVRLVPPPPAATPTAGEVGPWGIEEIGQPCVSITGVVALPASVGVLGSTPSEAQAVFEIPLDGGPSVRLSESANRPAGPDAGPPSGVDPDDIAVARPFRAATPAGTVPGQFFAPANAAVGPTPPGPPPLVVFCHGGPTGSAPNGFDPVVQFFTNRGLAVAAVDYRGSAGYGREFRQSLSGLWGQADIDDCIGYASALVDAGLVDGRRMAIRGTSAGGLTALGALVRSDRFAGAAAWYGVTDLEALATGTHDFESRYMDSLVGPWPEAAAVYRARSPIHHADRVTGSVLLLQGADDPVVPADHHGVPCRLTVFEGESHGFRRAGTIEASLLAELDFYRSLFDDADGGH
jgi:dipeptidyl aminopeptidase/acylaminoacyl peptidase